MTLYRTPAGNAGPRRTPVAGAPATAAPVTLAVLVALLWLAAPAALACSCMVPPPPLEALAQVDAVFTAVAERVERAEVDTGYGMLPRKRVELRLEAVWKGMPEGDSVTVWTGLGGGDCGFAFEEGKSYLVYARRHDDGRLTTGLCDRTRPREGADEELDALGEPVRCTAGEE